MKMKIIDILMIINYLLLLINILLGKYILLLFGVLMAILTVLKVVIYRKESKKIFLFLGIAPFILRFAPPILYLLLMLIFYIIDTINLFFTSPSQINSFNYFFHDSFYIFEPTTTAVMTLVIGLIFLSIYIIDSNIQKRRKNYDEK